MRCVARAVSLSRRAELLRQTPSIRSAVLSCPCSSRCAALPPPATVSAAGRLRRQRRRSFTRRGRSADNFPGELPRQRLGASGTPAEPACARACVRVRVAEGPWGGDARACERGGRGGRSRVSSLRLQQPQRGGDNGDGAQQQRDERPPGKARASDRLSACLSAGTSSATARRRQLASQFEVGEGGDLGVALFMSSQCLLRFGPAPFARCHLQMRSHGSACVWQSYCGLL